MIKVSINGEIKEIKEGITLKELLEELGYDKGGFAVAINVTFVPVDNYEQTMLHEGDKIDILAPVQGG